MSDTARRPAALAAASPSSTTRCKVDDLDAAKELVAKAAPSTAGTSPSWIETTAEETGEKQGREAVRAGADVVASLGGDGTVRAVASALVGTDVALGLLPGGTGNLLARNLGLPVDSLEDAVDALLGGRDRASTSGSCACRRQTCPSPRRATATQRRAGPRSAHDEEVFLVMTGLGLDGEVMADTNEKVKESSAGSPTSSAGCARALRPRLHGRRCGPPADEGDRRSGAGRSVERHARAVVVGNCGTLQGGVELMPEAKVDDGVLDAVVIAPKGVFGWVSVLADVVTRHRAGHSRLDRLAAASSPSRPGARSRPRSTATPSASTASLGVRVLPESLVVRVG